MTCYPGAHAPWDRTLSARLGMTDCTERHATDEGMPKETPA
jgi:hypothetical protein